MAVKCSAGAGRWSGKRAQKRSVTPARALDLPRGVPFTPVGVPFAPVGVPFTPVGVPFGPLSVPFTPVGVPFHAAARGVRGL